MRTRGHDARSGTPDVRRTLAPEYLGDAYAQVRGYDLWGARNGQVKGCGRASVMTTTSDVERGHHHAERAVEILREHDFTSPTARLVPAPPGRRKTGTLLVHAHG